MGGRGVVLLLLLLLLLLTKVGGGYWHNIKPTSGSFFRNSRARGVKASQAHHRLITATTQASQPSAIASQANRNFFTGEVVPGDQVQKT